MTANSSKGVVVRMVKKGAVGVVVNPSAITSASPAVATMTSTTGIIVGDLVYFPPGATGMPGLDGKTFTVSVVTGTALTLFGSDTIGQTFLTTAIDGEAFGKEEMAILCLSTLSFSPNTPQAISTATYCDPSAQITSAVVQPGTVAITGFIDTTDDGYKEIQMAEKDGVARNFSVQLPSPSGWINFDGSVGGLSYDLPVDGAMGYSATITLSAKPIHAFI